MKGDCEKLAAIIHDKLESLENSTSHSRDDLTNVPEKGVYIFYENDKAMYVGRSNRNLQKRIQQYTHHKPPIGFARNLCEEIIRERGGIIPKKRDDLQNSQEFKEAINRISKMQVRVIEIIKKKEQALFELYAQIELEPKCNDFDTH